MSAMKAGFEGLVKLTGVAQEPFLPALFMVGGVAAPYHGEDVGLLQ